MKRDWELMRAILEALEQMEGTDQVLRPDQVEGFDREQVAYHMWLLYQAGLIEARCRDNVGMKIDCVAFRLTWDGHELLDKIRPVSVWKSIVRIAREKGVELSYETVLMVATRVIREMIG
jgi:hypothetical protein